MRAIVIDQFGGRDVLKERDVPIHKPSRNEVRIKVKAVGFNPVDWKIREGMIGGECPIILGSECSGIIDAVGQKFHDFSVGDQVCALTYGPCSNGSYAEYLCIPTQFVIKKPKYFNSEQGAAFPLTYLTAFQALISKGAFQKNRSLFIAGGSGGVGSAAIALAQCYGAGSIFTTAGSEESRDYLMDVFHLPKENILSYRGAELEEMRDELIGKNGGERFYFTFDCVGGMMKQLCLSLCDFNGHLATILPENESFDLPLWGRHEHAAFNKSISVHPIYVGSAAHFGNEKSWNVYKVQLEQLVKLFEKEGLILPQTENVGSFSLETVQNAHKRLEEGHTKGKLVMAL